MNKSYWNHLDAETKYQCLLTFSKNARLGRFIYEGYEVFLPLTFERPDLNFTADQYEKEIHPMFEFYLTLNTTEREDYLKELLGDSFHEAWIDSAYEA